MYNNIFQADYLLFKEGCAVETVAFVEMVLRFFEQERLPVAEEFLKKDEYKFKLEDIVDSVFEKDDKNRYARVKFPESYNDSELVKKIKEMFFDNRYGIVGKNFEELMTISNRSPFDTIREEKYLFQILLRGMSLVLLRSPYNFRCTYSKIDNEPYFIIGSWDSRTWGK